MLKSEAYSPSMKNFSFYKYILTDQAQYTFNTYLGLAYKRKPLKADPESMFEWTSPKYKLPH